MKRNYTSIKGAGFSRAFQAAAATPEPPAPAPVAPAPKLAPVRVCDRSGDAGTTHYWPAGAAVGDWCLCGKRRRFTPFPQDAA